MAVYFLGAALLLAGMRSPDGHTDAVSRLLRRNGAAVWSLAAVTATGRVLADVHW